MLSSECKIRDKCTWTSSLYCLTISTIRGYLMFINLTDMSLIFTQWKFIRDSILYFNLKREQRDWNCMNVFMLWNGLIVWKPAIASPPTPPDHHLYYLYQHHNLPPLQPPSENIQETKIHNTVLKLKYSKRNLFHFLFSFIHSYLVSWLLLFHSDWRLFTLMAWWHSLTLSLSVLLLGVSESIKFC